MSAPGRMLTAVVRRGLPVGLVVTLLPSVQAPAVASTRPATISAPVSVTPGTRVRVSISSVSCAAAPIVLRQRSATTRRIAVWRTVGHRAASSRGKASFVAAVPADAVKTSVGIPVYWVATSSYAACNAALSAVAGHSTIFAPGRATVTVIGTAGHPHLSVAGCRGGIADAYVVDSHLRQTPILGLRTSADGSLSAPLHVPRGAAALFLDCLQATVSSYTQHGAALPGGRPAAAANRDGAAPVLSEADDALRAAAPCAPGGPYGWPLICGASSPVVAMVQMVQRNPTVRAQEQRLLGSDLVTPKLAALADLALEHPRQPVPALAAFAAAANQPEKMTGGTTTKSSHTTTSDKTDVNSDYSFGGSPANPGGIYTTAVETTVMHPDAAKKLGLRSVASTTRLSFNTANATCPDPDGKLPLASEWTLSVAWNIVDGHGRRRRGSVDAHGSVKVTPEVNDAAEYTGFQLDAAAEFVGSTVFPPSRTEQHAAFRHHYRMHKPQDIYEVLGKAAGSQASLNAFLASFSSYGPAGSRAPNGATAALLAALGTGLLAAEGGAYDAYRQFNERGSCLTLGVPDNAPVRIGSSRTFTFTIADVAGGHVTVHVAAKALGAGTLNPDQFTLTDTNPQTSTLTAPSDPGVTTSPWYFTGLSNRGALRASWTFTLSAPLKKLVLRYSASTSEQYTCDGKCAFAFGPNATEMISGSASGTVTGTVTVPGPDSTQPAVVPAGIGAYNTEDATGSETVTVKSESVPVGPPECAVVDGHETHLISGHTPGPLTVPIITYQRAADGSLTGIDALVTTESRYGVEDAHNEQTLLQSTTDTFTTDSPDPCRATLVVNNGNIPYALGGELLKAQAAAPPAGDYSSVEAHPRSDITTTLTEAYTPEEVTAWKIYPDGGKSEGGVVAEATLSYSGPGFFSFYNGSSSLSTVTQKLQLVDPCFNDGC